MKLYNTQSRKKEVFKPQNAEQVSMYVCGPTVYNYAHIGNARPAVVFDLLYRLLNLLYPKVIYVRNITDIDDKILNKAREEGLGFDVIAQRYYHAYQEDMRALNVRRPSEEPWATQHLETMFELITSLLDKGYAYQVQGHVLFHVPHYAQYGKLSRQEREEMLAGARVELASYKKDVADFVLWKPSTPKQPGWPSPWGYGRPGWHIECSAMIHAYFGSSVDIHGGGHDLIFPHHENELAQSTCANDKSQPFVRYWIHNGFVRMERQKMSKSLGNVLLIREALSRNPGEVIRLALLSAHYRRPLDWSEQMLSQSCTILNRYYECLASLEEEELKVARNAKTKVTIPSDFIEALKDDLNTPQALAILHDLSLRINRSQTKERRRGYCTQLLACGELLGILQCEPKRWLQNEWMTSHPKSEDIPESLSIAEIERQIHRRREARSNGDFTEADKIRDELVTQGILLRDGPEKTEWRRKSS